MSIALSPALPDVSEHVAAVKAAAAAKEADRKAQYARLQADAAATAAANAKAAQEAERAKAAKLEADNERRLRAEAYRGWPHTEQGAAAFDAWWQATGRVETLAADARKRQAVVDRSYAVEGL